MDEVHHKRDKALIKRLIDSFASGPLQSSLGTLSPIDTEATQALVGMGKEAVPELVRALGSDKPTIVIYAAYCLGQLGEMSAVPQLRQVQQRYSTKDPKNEFDFSVANAARIAIERLSDSRKSGT